MSTVNSTAPDFTLKNTKKEDVSLSDFKGKTVVLAFILVLSLEYAILKCAN